MAGVRYVSSVDHRMVTTCCGRSIFPSQKACPSCGEKIPHSFADRQDMALRNPTSMFLAIMQREKRRQEGNIFLELKGEFL